MIIFSFFIKISIKKLKTNERQELNLLNDLKSEENVHFRRGELSSAGNHAKQSNCQNI